MRNCTIVEEKDVVTEAISIFFVQSERTNGAKDQLYGFLKTVTLERNSSISTLRNICHPLKTFSSYRDVTGKGLQI